MRRVHELPKINAYTEKEYQTYIKYIHTYPYPYIFIHRTYIQSQDSDPGNGAVPNEWVFPPQ